MIAAALTEPTIWPNFTVPFFEVKTEDQRRVAGAEILSFAPIIKLEQKVGWEQYAVHNQGWIREGLDLRGMHHVEPGPISSVIKNTPQIDQDVYSPVWQMAPAPTNATPVMTDMFAEDWFRVLAYQSVQVDHALLSGIQELDFLIGHSRSTKTHDLLPRSMVVQSVFNAFETSTESATEQQHHESAVPRQLLGFSFAVVPWESFFENSLPEGKMDFTSMFLTAAVRFTPTKSTGQWQIV